jgi:hypothetical protein
MGKILAMKKLMFSVLLGLILIGCRQPKQDSAEALSYKAEMEAWHKKRVDRLLGPSGWVNVRGLYWLMEGINSFGSGKENNIVFPEGKIAEKAGFFILRDSIVSMQVLPDVKILSNGEPVRSLVIFQPDTTRPKVLESGSLQWFVIKRSNKIGIRLRDLQSENIKNFKGIDHFEFDLDLRVKAKITKQPGKYIDIVNVLGQTYRTPVTGILTFTIDGRDYKLEAIDEDGKLFIIYGDATNGKTTYGSGRYLYADMPTQGDEVDLDFNKSINPPCAFTEFATCLLPPQQNILPIEVLAGEKAYH